MTGLILATASVIALGIGGAGTANAWSGSYSGATVPPSARTYSPNYSSYTAGAAYRPGGLVVQTQLALRRDGLYRGKIDGVLGPETREALGAYQSRRGLPITNRLSAATMASLGVGPVYQGSSYPGAAVPSGLGRRGRPCDNFSMVIHTLQKIRNAIHAAELA